MAEEKLLTIRDVSIILGVSEKEVVDFAESGQLPAYKIGGVYLRFKREQIEEFRKSFKPHKDKTKTSKSDQSPTNLKSSLRDNFSDFFYFNDFYILSALIIILILIIIFRGY